jgi:signal transduction histidine kinase
MDRLPYIILVISLLLSLAMSGVSLFYGKSLKQKKSASWFEFWPSMSVSVLFSMIFWRLDGLHALSVLGWIWPMRTLVLMLEEFGGKKILTRTYFLFWGGAVFLTLILMVSGYSFRNSTLIPSLLMSGLGVFTVINSYRLSSQEQISIFVKSSYGFMGLFFLSKMSFPFWEDHKSLMDYSLGLELFILASLGVTSLGAHLELMKKSQENVTEKVLKERSEKFIGQSKFSELGMLSAGIAHEINNPLAVIMARTSQLLRVYQLPEKNAEVGQGLSQIYRTSERINKTIQGIREFVHEDEKGPLAEVNLKELFESVLAFCGQRMKNHGVNLRLYGIENVSVKGHKVQLEQVILNLFNNSFDAIEFLGDKWIEVSCHQRNGKIQLYFKDSGHGIPPEIASRIMEPFFSTKEVGKGTGLGLSLAQGIIQKHSGSLTYLKERPFTTFLLELPVTLQ